MMVNSFSQHVIPYTALRSFRISHNTFSDVKVFNMWGNLSLLFEPSSAVGKVKISNQIINDFIEVAAFKVDALVL
jgi:hypothetical protein